MKGKKIEYCEYADDSKSCVKNTELSKYIKKSQKTKRGYECLFEDSETKFHFDYDKGNAKNPIKTEKKWKDEIKIAKFLFKNDIQELLKKHFGKDIKTCIAEDNRFQKKDDYEGYKVSYHITITNKYNSYINFVEYIKKNEREFGKYFDMSIYRKGMSKWRTPGTEKIFKKKNKNSSKCSIMKIESGKIEDHIVQNIEGCEKYELSLDEELEKDYEEEEIKEKKEVEINKDQLIKINLLKKMIGEFENTADESYSVWLTFGSMIYGIFNGSDEGLKLFKKFSELSIYYKKNKYQAEREINDKWSNEFKKMEYHPDIGYLVNCAKKYESYELYKNILVGLNIKYDKDSYYYESDEYFCGEFVKKYRNQVIYDRENKEWFIKNKFGIYEKDDIKLIKLLKELKDDIVDNIHTIKKLNSDNQDYFKKLSKLEVSINNKIANNKNRKNVIEYLISSELNKSQIKWNEDRDYWAFNNGVFSFKENKIVYPPNNIYISFTCGYNYEEKENKEIKDYIYKIYKDIHDDEKILNEFFKVLSLSLNGNDEEIFTFWLGTGRNGKGLTIDLLKEVFGEYMQVLNGDYFAKTKHQSHSNAADEQLFQCIGKRLVIADEFPKNTKIKENTLKALSGKTNLKVRGLYKSAVEFKPNFLLIFAMNIEDMPEIKVSESSMEERFVPFEFMNTFKKNPDPKNKNEKKADPKLKKNVELLKLEFWRILKDFYIKNNDINYKLLKEKRDQFLLEHDPINDIIDEYECIEIDEFNKLKKNEYKLHLYKITDLCKIISKKCEEKYTTKDFTEKLIKLGVFKDFENEIIQDKNKVKYVPFTLP